MKRWLSGLLAALALFSLTACGGMAGLADVPEGPQFEEANMDLPTAENPEDSAGPEEEAPEAGGFSIAENPEAGSPTLSGAGGGKINSDLPEGDLIAGASNADLPEHAETLPEDGTYTSKEDVALYIYTYGHLPDNFITKKEAQNLGWPGGDLEPYAPGMCIGGSRFGNYEGLLPEAEGRTYTECDVDTLGAKSRGAKRIVFSNDGLIYYTGDHYASFELLYGDEGDG